MVLNWAAHSVDHLAYLLVGLTEPNLANSLAESLDVPMAENLVIALATY